MRDEPDEVELFKLGGKEIFPGMKGFLLAGLQYFTVPLPFLQESSGIHRNPQESSGILRNGTGIRRNPQESAGMGQE